MFSPFFAKMIDLDLRNSNKHFWRRIFMNHFNNLKKRGNYLFEHFMSIVLCLPLNHPSSSPESNHHPHIHQVLSCDSKLEGYFSPASDGKPCWHEIWKVRKITNNEYNQFLKEEVHVKYRFGVSITCSESRIQCSLGDQQSTFSKLQFIVICVLLDGKNLPSCVEPLLTTFSGWGMNLKKKSESKN